MSSPIATELNDSMNSFIASPTTDQTSLANEISNIEERYEDNIRQIVQTLKAQRDELKSNNVQLMAELEKMRADRDQKSNEVNSLVLFRDKAVPQLTVYREKCQQLEAKIHELMNNVENATKSSASSVDEPTTETDGEPANQAIEEAHTEAVNGENAEETEPNEGLLIINESIEID